MSKIAEEIQAQQDLVVKRIHKVFNTMVAKDAVVTDLTGNLQLKIIYAGEFLDDEGELVDFEDNIKLVRGHQSMNLSPSQCKEFVKVIKNYPEVREELNRRLSVEKSRIAGL